MLGLSVAWTGTLYKRWCDTGTLESPETIAWQAMTDKLAIPANKELYKQRSPKIEARSHISKHIAGPMRSSDTG